ncbi:MAG: cyclohexane-carbonyl-CoA dehydrogenase [Thermodesulfobacteriota bacterium]|nr:cyclohexane-carbonyl-CoA dehydrogenase [Thermodesulfobacteriota bacterium]
MDNKSIEESQELTIFREAVRRASREKIAPLASSIDETGEFNREVEALCWDLGLLTLALPPEFGGLEKNAGTALCIAVEELARVCAASALLLIIQAVGSYPIVHGLSRQIRDKVLTRIAEERRLVAYLVTEPSGGSDVAGLKTTAVRDGNEYVLNGTKCFATNGGVASIYSVLARTSKEGGQKGLSFFLVERDNPGVKVGRLENKLGQRGSNTTEVFLDDVRVPVENLLGEEGKGFFLAMKDFDMSRPAVGAQALGIAEGAFEAMLKYSTERRTFGKFLAQHQMIQAIIADSATLIEASRGLVYRAAALYDENKPNTKIASMAKCFTSDAAMKITTDAVQVLGGYGYMKDFNVERMFRDAKLTQIFEGANQIQRIVIAREIFKESGLSI